MKQITLKFTIANGWASHMLYWVFKHPYTHTALSIDDITFYSFTYGGFTTEKKRKYIPQKWNDCYSYCYLEINDHMYDHIQNIIEKYIKNKEKLKYSYLTIIGAFFKIPIQEKNKYTCSQFVANLLKSSQAFPLKQKSCLYLPYHIVKEIKKIEHIEEHQCLK